MGASRSIVVVGAGIFGVAGALELRRRGWHVLLLDPGPLPRPVAASTDISKMVRLDYGADEAYMALMEEALTRWEAWNARWGTELYHEDGLLVLSCDEMRAGGFEHESLALLRKRGHRAERIDSRTLAARFPAWKATRYSDGYVNPRGGWAESGRVVGRLLADARVLGVEVREGTGFARLLEHGSRVEGIETEEGERLHADRVLIAAGGWTPALLPELQDLLWTVGQPVLHLRTRDVESFRPPRFLPWSADIARTGWYGFPALSDGTLKIANHGTGRRVHPDEPRTIAPTDEDRFRAFLRESLPSLADAPVIGSRLCLYCDSWDGNFWIDLHPEREGLAVAAGDSGHAFKFAPLLGDWIADVVERRLNPHTARFAWRRRGDLSAEEARFTGSGM